MIKSDWKMALLLVIFVQGGIYDVIKNINGESKLSQMVPI